MLLLLLTERYRIRTRSFNKVDAVDKLHANCKTIMFVIGSQLSRHKEAVDNRRPCEEDARRSTPCVWAFLAFVGSLPGPVVKLLPSRDSSGEPELVQLRLQVLCYF